MVIYIPVWFFPIGLLALIALIFFAYVGAIVLWKS